MVVSESQGVAIGSNVRVTSVILLYLFDFLFSCDFSEHGPATSAQ